ncbi:hypothetical protein V1478_001374 [Vespula squamosa]|uniref:Uncharacterized protein n=1 Tax=Vespula squamosa TaxID=30214 RepID=A0ABD2C193_VESSQ
MSKEPNEGGGIKKKEEKKEKKATNKKHWRISGLKNKLMNIQASTQRQYGFLDHLRLEKTWPTKLADVEHLMAVTWWPVSDNRRVGKTVRGKREFIDPYSALMLERIVNPSVTAAAVAAATAVAVAVVPSRTSNSRSSCSSNNNGGAIKRIRYFCLDRILCSLLRHSICYDDISKSAPPGARECLFSVHDSQEDFTLTLKAQTVSKIRIRTKFSKGLRNATLHLLLQLLTLERNSAGIWTVTRGTFYIKFETQDEKV